MGRLGSNGSIDWTVWAGIVFVSILGTIGTFGYGFKNSGGAATVLTGVPFILLASGKPKPDLRSRIYRTVAVLRTVLVAMGVGVGALLAGTVFPLVGVGVLFVTGTLTETKHLFALGILLFGIGLLVFAYLFLRITGRKLDYIEVRWPTLGDIGYTVAGMGVLIGLAFVLGFLFAQFNVPTADHSVEETANVEGAEILLWAIPLAWIAIGLGEEVVFRGVIQRYLSESVAVWWAIVIASGIFALVHIPAYYTSNRLALSSVLVLIFVLSIILGWTYERTNNLLVPVFIHGTYNAIVFFILYVSLTG